VEGGLEVNPDYPAALVFLSGQAVSNEVVPVEEPAVSEDIQDIKDGVVVGAQLRGDGRDGLSRLGGREGALGLSVRRGESRGWNSARWHI
jgi:hypothetical protein